ncbi:MAG TPA: hypothetical protein PK747_08070 [Acidobacteriota bacterium]|nr:hypothetical protein [Acidobacteriota bacterium]HQQ47348.1 hypothetical protein [Acidobacteriota bacterium]
MIGNRYCVAGIAGKKCLVTGNYDRRKKLRMYVFFLTFLSLLIFHPCEGSRKIRRDADDNNYVISGNWRIVWNADYAKAQNAKTKKVVDIYKRKEERWIEKYEDESDPERSYVEEKYYDEWYSTVSIVGSIVSYQKSYDGSGGMHPIYGSMICAIDLDKEGTPADIRELFPETQLLEKFIVNDTISRYLTKKKVSSLNELYSSLDGGCEVNFKDLFSSFCVSYVENQKVYVLFYLTHGCEAMRGHTTDFEISIDVQKKQAVLFKKAVLIESFHRGKLL